MRKVNYLCLCKLGAVLLMASGIPDTYAQYALFERNTDTIEVEGASALQDACTFEAVFMLPSSLHSGGDVFNEWTAGQQDKLLRVSSKSLTGRVWPNNVLSVSQDTLISLDVWHHVAFVFDSAEQSLYLDGSRISSTAALQRVGNGQGLGFVGAILRDGAISPSFVGYLDSIRISKVARYAGSSLTVPKGDMASDEDTLLLYNFNDPEGSATVQDESPLNRTGHLGIGFASASSPKISSRLPTEVDLKLQIFTAVEVQFSSSENGTYYIQSSPDMTVWKDVPGAIIGDGNIMKKLISTQDKSRLFYRVVSRP